MKQEQACGLHLHPYSKQPPFQPEILQSGQSIVAEHVFWVRDHPQGEAYKAGWQPILSEYSSWADECCSCGGGVRVEVEGSKCFQCAVVNT